MRVWLCLSTTNVTNKWQYDYVHQQQMLQISESMIMSIDNKCYEKVRVWLCLLTKNVMNKWEYDYVYWQQMLQISESMIMSIDNKCYK